MLLMLLVCTVVSCGLCHLLVARQLEQPAAKPAKKGHYRGMQEFEMPEIKSNTWGMP